MNPLQALSRCVLCLTAASAPGKAPLCLACGLLLRSQQRRLKPAARVTSLYHYRDSIRALTLRAKVRSDHRALDLLAHLVASHPAAVAAAQAADALLVCPSSLWGRWRGRLDVAHHLAWHLGRTTNRPVLPAPPHLYWRWRKRARHKGDAPLPASSASPLWRGALRRWQATVDALTPADRPLHLLVVDDVVTTGHTLATVIAQLPTAAKVRILTMASGGEPVSRTAFGLPRVARL